MKSVIYTGFLNLLPNKAGLYFLLKIEFKLQAGVKGNITVCFLFNEVLLLANIHLKIMGI